MLISSSHGDVKRVPGYKVVKLRWKDLGDDGSTSS